jgi:spore coat protein A
LFFDQFCKKFTRVDFLVFKHLCPGQRPGRLNFKCPSQWSDAMFSRRKFVQSALAGAGLTSISALFPKTALAQFVPGIGKTFGSDLASGTWASVTDPGLFGKVWGARFTNVLPWALDPTNTVLAKALNVDATGFVPGLNKSVVPAVVEGLKINAAKPETNIGFVFKPDAGNTYNIKAGQIDWPMLAPLGTVGIPTTKTWGYGNTQLESVFSDGSGLPVTFPGRTFVVRRNAAINVNWRNELVDANGDPLPHLLGIDQSISMQTDQTIHSLVVTDPNPDPLKNAGFINQEVFSGNAIVGVPIAVHHHGGDTAKEFDGGPDQWITPRRVQAGPGVTGNNDGGTGLAYTYDNKQEASMTWYHDHGEGVTRINAYGGLAGLYVIRDANEDKLVAQAKIPSGPYELPVVLQDKCFTADGSMAYAADPADYPVPDLVLPSPTHHPEQFGDVIVINGVAWPQLNVEPREYRLRLLNGSDSRVYVLQFGHGGANRRGGFNQTLPIFKITTDLGFLNNPIEMNAVTIAPGERMDVVVDFSMVKAVNGKKEVVVTNSGAIPFPLGAPTVPNTPGAGTVMRFNVNQPLNANTTALGLPAIPKSKITTLKQNVVLRGLDPATPLLVRKPVVPAGTTVRRILLAEGVDEHGRLTPLLGSFQFPTDPPLPNGYPNNPGTLGFSQLPTEAPKLGTSEVWEFWNNSPDAHPIHLHLVKFRLLNREVFGPSALATGGVMAESKPMINGWTGERLLPEMVQLGSLQNPPVPPVPAPADEQGWKDTILAYPGEVTRILMKFDRPGKYVYHCHILAHEEHDMMRWYEVV